MNHSKIGTIEAITVILSVIIIHTILSLPKTVLSQTKSATILNIVYVGIITVIFVYIIYRLLKNFSGMDILDISEICFGKTFKNILGTIFIVYFLVSSSMFLRNFCECLQIVYYPSTDIIFVILFFIITICAVNHLSFNSSLKANLIIVPIVFISIIFLFFSNMRFFSMERIFPVLGDGFINTFITGLGNISSFGGIVFLYFLPPLLEKSENFKKIAILSVIATSIYLILVMSLVLFMFNFFINTDEIMPLYYAARHIEFGSFFQRLESIFLLIWMMEFSCYLSIVTKFSIYIFKKITNIRYTNMIILPIGFIILGISLIPKNYSYSRFYETNIYPVCFIILTIFISTFVLLFANFKRIKKVGEQNEKNN